MRLQRESDRVLDGVKRVHFVGIGGSGMSPLAEIMHGRGYTLSGSDNNEGTALQRMRALGIPVIMGHKAENVHGAQLVVYTAAISKDNPELTEAARLGIPTLERCDLLGILTRRYDNVIGVCGTHGKTTVSSMLTQILLMNHMDPTAVIGGRLPLLGANGCSGKSENMVCESCEFVDSFLSLSPDIAVLLNIDNDHLDYFKTMENLVASFHKFVSMATTVFVNGDCALCGTACRDIQGKIITFGMEESNMYCPSQVAAGQFGMTFIVMKQGNALGRITLSIPGRHNIYNALAAIAVADEMGVPFKGIQSALESFHGAGRRFERLGEFDGITLVDDYAHHPTEIAATLKAAGNLKHKHVIAVFQPFTFSRTALLKDEFIAALRHADKVILTPIMGSREVNTFGISSEDLAAGLEDCVCVPDFDGVVKAIDRLAEPGDIVITMGGGDIYKAAHLYSKTHTR